MYVKLARLAAKQDRVLVPNECVPGGATSRFARRVWEGEEFQQAVEVYEGLVAWGG